MGHLQLNGPGKERIMAVSFFFCFQPDTMFVSRD